VSDVADMMETMEGRLRNLPAAPPERAVVPSSADGIAHRISAAGLQISQAADELQQAARGLLEADRAAREAEARWAKADAQLAQAAEKNAELLAALETARSDQAEADERARRAEQHLQTTVEHQAEMETQLAEIEAKWREADAQPKVTLIVDEERDELQQTLGSEIRRPLTSILGLTLALKHADPKSAESKNMIKQLTTNARRLDRLVGQMLDLDKIAAGAFVPNRRRTDVEALVRRVVEEAPDLANRDLKLETEHVAINVDPALAEQMVETLLMNAGRRSAPGNPVWVKVSSDQDGVVIAVDDTGPETPAGLRAGKLSGSLADDRGPAARRKKPRGATGLALLSRLAELHGGRAWVEERPGGGASFRVFLPNAAQEPHEEGTDARAVDLVPEEEEGEVLFDTAIASSGRELSSFDDLTGDIAI
jgi:signal transduction histidine kinase